MYVNLFFPLKHCKELGFIVFFYIAANAYSPYVFTKAMDKIKEKDASAYPG